MKKKLLGVFVVMLLIATGFGSFIVTANVEKIDIEDVRDINIDDQSIPKEVDLGSGIVHATGVCGSSYVQANCAAITEVSCSQGDIITFTIDYILTLPGQFDWGRVKCIVNGVSKLKESTYTTSGTFSWPITVDCGEEVDWWIEAWLTDWPACEKKQTCDGSLIFVCEDDLSCDGSINGGGYSPGQPISDSFTVRNIGSAGSLLDWEVVEWPSWGSGWTFSPKEGENLNSGSSKTVNVYFNAPTSRTSYSGNIKIINQNNPSDDCEISAYITVPRYKSILRDMSIMNVLKQFPNAFPILTVSFSNILYANAEEQNIISIGADTVIAVDGDGHFGSVDIGTASYCFFLLMNMGTEIAEGTVWFSSTPYGFTITEGFGPFELGPHKIKTIWVKFVPTKAIDYYGTLGIDGYNCNDIEVPLSGKGTKTYFANDILVFEENPPLSVWIANNFYIKGYIGAWIEAVINFLRNMDRAN